MVSASLFESVARVSGYEATLKGCCPLPQYKVNAQLGFQFEDTWHIRNSSVFLFDGKLLDIWSLW